MPNCHYFHHVCGRENKVNFGDNLATHLIKHYHAGPVTLAKSVDDQKVVSMHLITGSILRNATRPNSIIWGCGIMSEGERPYHMPRKICAVRGKLTRQTLEAAQIPCPQVYGDPGILVSHVFPTTIAPIYDVGIVPHYVDYKDVLLKIHSPNIRVIDLTNPDIQQVALEIAACKYTISSSLHGLVASHAYGAQSAWVLFSDKVYGKGFKFRDYYSAFDMEAPTPLELCAADLNCVSTLIEKIQAVPQPSKAKIQKVQDDLIRACPFTK